MTQFKKTVVITGAYGGLGSAFCKVYSDNGYNLCLIGKDENKLKNLKTSLATKVLVKTFKCDLSCNEEIVEVCERIKEEFSRIDVVINCAAIFPISSASEMDLLDFQRCLQINVTAPFLITKQFISLMKTTSGGKIINIASSSAYGGAPNTSAYCASKHALLGLSRSWFKELKQDNIRVYCVSPGSIQTEMGREVEKLGQLYDTFMTAEEVAQYTFSTTSYEGNMISEEVRLNRVFVQ